jgi:hypothetical protein
LGGSFYRGSTIEEKDEKKQKKKERKKRNYMFGWVSTLSHLNHTTKIALHQ